MRIIVTGASGFLGSSISFIARSKGHAVMGTYNQHQPGMPGCRFLKLDLLSKEPSREKISQVLSFRPDCIIHCAALTNLDFCEANPELARKVNVGGSSTMATLAKEAGCKFIMISTDSVFNGKYPFHTEDEPVSPLNMYSRTKCGAEDAARCLENHAIIRTNFYGLSHSKKNFGEWLYGGLVRGERIPAFTDYYFSPILVNNLVDALLEIAAGGFRGTINICGDGRLTKNDFAHKFASKLKLDAGLIDAARMSDRADFIAPRPNDCSLDISKAKRALETPLLSINWGITRFKSLLNAKYLDKFDETLKIK